MENTEKAQQKETNQTEEKTQKDNIPSDGKLRIGIAFGGGGAKGFAHVGILKVFEKYGIKPDFIAGTSVGSIIGATYALGYSADEIIARGASFTKKFSKFKNFNLFSESIIKDKNINKAIKDLVGEESTFKDLKIPYIATAVDLESGNEITIKEGKLWEVARASSAIPFIFTPFFVNEKYLVDGGLLNNVPVDHLREQGNLDLIIGIELGGMTSRQYISGMVWEKHYRKPKTFEMGPSFLTKWKLNMNLLAHIFLRSLDIMREVSQKARYEKAKPDIMIKPNVDSISLLEFDRYKEGIDIGVDAAEAVMPKLLELIKEKKAEKMRKKAQSIVDKQIES